MYYRTCAYCPHCANGKSCLPREMLRTKILGLGIKSIYHECSKLKKTFPIGALVQAYIEFEDYGLQSVIGFVSGWKINKLRIWVSEQSEWETMGQIITVRPSRVSVIDSHTPLVRICVECGCPSCETPRTGWDCDACGIPIGGGSELPF